MKEKSSKEEILHFFFQHPTREVHLRQLSRTLDISLPTIIQHVTALKKKGFVNTRRVGTAVLVRANFENDEFVWRKRLENIFSLYESGLVQYLEQTTHRPSVLVCFGSYARGDDIESSDIDIAIIDGKSIGSVPGPFEKELKRTISLKNVDMKTISDDFRKNLYNGIVLRGAW